MSFTVSSKRLVNYLTQLRAYSYVDLLLLMMALQASPFQVTVKSLLWFGFLIHLEWMHKDRGRERWPIWTWMTVWLLAILLQPTLSTAVFIVLAALYSLKKRIPWIGSFSYIYNGLLKVALIWGLPGATMEGAALVLIVMSLRNLAGDFRDIERDSTENVQTLPVRLGMKRDVRWLYPLTLAITTIVWTVLGELPIYFTVIALAIEALTYRLTPR